jgi:hypothetical protein
VDILELLASVKLVSDGLEVSLHHVNVLFVVSVLNAGIPDDDDAVLMETLGNLFALQAPGSLVSFFEVGFEVNDGDVIEDNVVFAKRFHAKVYLTV